ncbi:DUF2892 domain-containing protein [Candidatus Bipolaricaulota bacterium]|nr:DUF2892 domain-containing protein [Candidatus Bipolaricaulota bacterium]
MKKNVGELDSRIRTRVGMILILLAIFGFTGLITIGTTASVILIIIGGISFGTGQSRSCAAYSILGMDTVSEKEKREER